jgi:hypothetical protein
VLLVPATMEPVGDRGWIPRWPADRPTPFKDVAFVRLSARVWLDREMGPDVSAFKAVIQEECRRRVRPFS